MSKIVEITGFRIKVKIINDNAEKQMRFLI